MRRDIEKVRIIAEADIRSGNSSKLKKNMVIAIEEERYEDAEGIKRAFENLNNKEEK